MKVAQMEHSIRRRTGQGPRLNRSQFDRIWGALIWLRAQPIDAMPQSIAVNAENIVVHDAKVIAFDVFRGHHQAAFPSTDA
jgi:hypothetical protein